MQLDVRVPFSIKPPICIYESETQITNFNFNLSPFTISSFMLSSFSTSQGTAKYRPASHSLFLAVSQTTAPPHKSGVSFKTD